MNESIITIFHCNIKIEYVIIYIDALLLYQGMCVNSCFQHGKNKFIKTIETNKCLGKNIQAFNDDKNQDLNYWLIGYKI